MPTSARRATAGLLKNVRDGDQSGRLSDAFARVRARCRPGRRPGSAGLRQPCPSGVGSNLANNGFQGRKAHFPPYARHDGGSASLRNYLKTLALVPFPQGNRILPPPHSENSATVRPEPVEGQKSSELRPHIRKTGFRIRRARPSASSGRTDSVRGYLDLRQNAIALPLSPMEGDGGLGG